MKNFVGEKKSSSAQIEKIFCANKFSRDFLFFFFFPRDAIKSFLLNELYCHDKVVMTAN